MFLANGHSINVIIPKELALAKRIIKGNKIRFKTMPDGTIVLEKVEQVETK